MNRRDFSSALSFPPPRHRSWPPRAPAPPARPGRGQEYTKLEPPQPTVDPGKIEVLEFFSYACPHCNAFEPTIEAWARVCRATSSSARAGALPGHADNFVHTYYALDTMGLVDKMQMKIFSAVHVDHLRLDKPEDIAALVGKNGGDAAKFLAAFKSFSVATAVSRSKKMTADYRVDAVLTLAIQGRFITSPEQAHGGPQALGVTDALIERLRKG